MLPSVKRHYPKGTKIIFVHDKATSHTANVTKEYISTHLPAGCDVRVNPTKSPDLQPIEKYWHSMEERVSRRRPTTIEQLRKYIIQDWNALTPEEIGKYFDKLEENLRIVAKYKGEFSGDEASIRKRSKWKF